jgi:hypothetical protein
MSGTVDKFNLDRYEGNPGPILQALAVLLAQRLYSQTLPEDELQVIKPEFRVEAERDRIRWLLQEAKKTMKGDKLVPLDSSGLPMMPLK